MKQLRILQVFPAFNTGGVEVGALAISNALQNSGHLSYIASAGGMRADSAVSMGARHFTLPDLRSKNPLKLPKLIKDLCKIIVENKIDIIHARSRWPAWAAYFAAKYTGKPFMTTVHGTHKVQNRFKRFYNSIMVRSNVVISNSDFTTDYILSTYKPTLDAYQSEIYTINRGIDETTFDPEKVSKEEVEKLRWAWNIEENEKVVLLPGIMTRRKGHEILIKALKKIDTTKIKALLLGAQETDSQTYRRELEDLIKQLKLESVVKILPSTAKMSTAYALADVVVYPFIQPEAFGRVIVEAQSMGIPIISSNMGAPARMIDNGVNGWLFEHHNPSSLAEKLNITLQLPEDVKKAYAKMVRQQVQEKYTQKLMCEKTIEVYNLVYKKHINLK